MHYVLQCNVTRTKILVCLCLQNLTQSFKCQLQDHKRGCILHPIELPLSFSFLGNQETHWSHSIWARILFSFHSPMLTAFWVSLLQNESLPASVVPEVLFWKTFSMQSQHRRRRRNSLKIESLFICLCNTCLSRFFAFASSSSSLCQDWSEEILRQTYGCNICLSLFCLERHWKEQNQLRKKLILIYTLILVATAVVSIASVESQDEMSLIALQTHSLHLKCNQKVICLWFVNAVQTLHDVQNWCTEQVCGCACLWRKNSVCKNLLNKSERTRWRKLLSWRWRQPRSLLLRTSSHSSAPEEELDNICLIISLPLFSQLFSLKGQRVSLTLIHSWRSFRSRRLTVFNTQSQLWQR